MKKTLFVLFMILALMLIITPVYAATDATPLPQSDIMQFYETEIKPYFIMALTGFGGSIGGCLLFLIRFIHVGRDSKKQRDEEKALVDGICETLGISHESSLKLQNSNHMIYNEVKNLVATEIRPLLTEVRKLQVENKQLRDMFYNTVKNTNEVQKTILKVLEISQLNNSELVRMGKTPLIEEVLKKYEVSVKV